MNYLEEMVIQSLGDCCTSPGTGTPEDYDVHEAHWGQDDSK